MGPYSLGSATSTVLEGRVADPVHFRPDPADQNSLKRIRIVKDTCIILESIQTSIFSDQSNLFTYFYVDFFTWKILSIIPPRGPRTILKNVNWKEKTTFNLLNKMANLSNNWVQIQSRRNLHHLENCMK